MNLAAACELTWAHGERLISTCRCAYTTTLSLHVMCRSKASGVQCVPNVAAVGGACAIATLE